MARRVPVPDAPPRIISPAVVMGDKASNAAVLVVWPVPPYVMPIAVPFQMPDVIVPIDASDESVVTAVLTNVPLVGSVTFVVAVTVKVVAKAPDVVKAPPKLTVLPPIFPTVVANVPDVFVTSPVRAGKAAVGKVDAAAATPAPPVHPPEPVPEKPRRDRGERKMSDAEKVGM